MVFFDMIYVFETISLYVINYLSMTQITIFRPVAGGSKNTGHGLKHGRS